MSAVVTAIAATAVVTGVMQGNAVKNAAESGTAGYQGYAKSGIDEVQKNLAELKKILSPYMDAGSKSSLSQQDLLGLNGPDAQQRAYNSIQNSPSFQGLMKQGEDAILQNASATGGLRGGNVQGALAQYRPQMLNSMINQQFQNLWSLSNLGAQTGANYGNASMMGSNSIANLLSNMGLAQANLYATKGQANAGLFGRIGGTIGSIIGMS